MTKTASVINQLRRVNLSAAAIVLICFFLPWVQVSCAGARDSLSGLDLAREGERLLWLVPLLMIAVLALGVMRFGERQASLFPIASLVSGLLSAYLLNREHAKSDRWSGLIVAQVTVWFWLALLASLVIVVSALLLFFRRTRAP